MRTLAVSCLFLLAAGGIAACGGGGGYSAPGSAAVPAAITAPTPTPAPVATPTPVAATTLATATLLGAAGFVNASGRTVYVLSGDTPAALECTVASGCTGVWPPVAPPAGIALSTGFAVFTRPDNGAMQLSYQGHPLYTYAGDSAAAQTNGNGLVSFGGTWSIARP